MIIAVAHHKGGAGKTTTAVNLAACWGAEGMRVLLIDCDPQGAATASLGVDAEALQCQALAPVAGRYDMILLDCPPSLDLLAVNTLVAADAVLIPTPPRLLDVRGIPALLEVMVDVRASLNPALRLLGVVVVQCEPRLSDTQTVLAALAEEGLPILQTRVRRAAAIARGQ
jgi:chromosome partitioning protein